MPPATNPEVLQTALHLLCLVLSRRTLLLRQSRNHGIYPFKKEHKEVNSHLVPNPNLSLLEKMLKKTPRWWYGLVEQEINQIIHNDVYIYTHNICVPYVLAQDCGFQLAQKPGPFIYRLLSTAYECHWEILMEFVFGCFLVHLRENWAKSFGSSLVAKSNHRSSNNSCLNTTTFELWSKPG